MKVFSSKLLRISLLSTIAAYSLAGCGWFPMSAKSSDSTSTSETYLQFKISSPTSTQAGKCVPLVISIANSSGQAVVPQQAPQIQIRGVDADELFSDSSCSSALTMDSSNQIQWPTAESSYSFFFKPGTARTYNLGIAKVESISNGTTTITERYIGIAQIIEAETPKSASYKLAITGPSSLVAGECKSYVLSLVDSAGVPQTLSFAATLNIGGGSAGSFYAGANCSGGAVTTLPLAAQTSIKSFSFKSSTAENLIFTVDAVVPVGKPAVASVFTPVQVLSGAQYAPSQLALSGPQTGTAASCTGPLLVKSLDSFGNASLATAAIPFSLIGNLGFQAFTDSACTTPLVAPQIAASSSAMNFYFTTSSAGNLTVTADDSGALLDAAMTVVMTGSVGGTASKLAITGPNNLPVNTCSSAYLVRAQDGSGVDHAVSSTTVVQLTGKGSGNFYGDSSCTTPVSSVSFASGDTVKSFYYKSPAVGAVVFNADNGGSLIPGSLSVNNIAGAATRLAISGPTNLNVSDCRAYTASSQDTSGFAAPLSSATAVNLTGTGSFYSDASCASSTSTVVINAGGGNAVFYYKSMVAGTFTIMADNGGALTSGTLGLTVAALPAMKVAISRPVMTSGLCTPLTVTLKDSLGGSVTASANTTVALSATGGSQVFSASDCNAGSVVTSATIASGQNSVSLFFRDLIAESVTLAATSTGLTGDSWATNIAAGAVAALDVSGVSTLAAGACSPYAVSLKDAHNNLTTSASPLTVLLTGAGSGKFSSTPDCANNVSSVTFSAGASQSVVYYSNSSAQSVTLLADSSGLTSGSKALTISASGAVKTKWTLTSTSATVGTCVVATLQIQDSLGNPVTQSSPATIQITGQGAATLYSSLACSTGGGLTSVTVTTGQSQVQFSIGNNTAETLSLSATSTGLSASSQGLVFNPGALARLLLQGPASVLAGDCTAYDLRAEDTLGNLAANASALTVNFAGLSSGKIYSDASCASQVTNVTLSSGTNVKTVYFKNTVAESVTINATGGALTAANKAVVVAALPAVKLAVSGPSSAAVQACAGPFTVTSRDSLGNGVVQGSNLGVNLSGGGNGLFYTDAACTGSVVTSVTIAAAAQSTSFYFKSSVPESLTLFASAASGALVDGTKTFTVNPLAPTKLVLAGLTNISAQTCSGFTVSVTDSLGNLSPTGTSKVVNFSGAGTGAFYSDSACTASVSSMTLSSSQTSLGFYYKAPSAQSVTLAVDDAGLPDLTAATLPVTVNAAAGGGMSLTLKFSGPASINTGTCSPFALTSVDSQGASVATSSNLSVSLMGAGGGDFYSDTGCTTSLSGTATIATGTSLKYIYFKAAAAQNLVFSASATSYSVGTFPVAVVSASSGGGVASRLAWSGSGAINTNECIPYVITLADSSGNSVNSTGSATAVTLQGNGTGGFFTENTCTTSAAGSATIALGQSFATVYFKAATPQNLVLIAQGTGLSNGTLPLTVTAAGGGSSSGPAVKLAFIAQPSSRGTVNVSFETQPVVAVMDSNGNVVSAANNSITLAAYSDSTCSTVAGGSLSATSNPLSAAGGIANFAGVSATHSQTIYLKASASGLVSACSTSVQVNPNVPTKLSFQTQPSNTATAGTALSVQPRVSILNDSSQVMTSATNSVLLEAFSDGACTTPVTSGFSVTSSSILPTSGIAIYSGVQNTKVGTIFLKASSSGLVSACSTGITVNPAVANKLAYYTAPPSSIAAGASFSTQVRIFDAYNNLITNTDTIVLTAHPNPDCSGTVTGTFTSAGAAAVLGTATLSGITYTKAEIIYLKAADSTTGGVTTACSVGITVRDSGTATTLAFSTQPSSTSNTNDFFPTQPVVQIRDSYGNVASSSATVTLAAFTDNTCTTPASGTLRPGTGFVAQSGIAAFTSLNYSASGTIYLQATSPGLTSACSTGITLAPSTATTIVSGAAFSCALMSGSVYCWGNGATGQLGTSYYMPKRIPTPVLDPTGLSVLTDVRTLAAGTNHACAATNAGDVYCWGYSGYGQLGDATTTQRSIPVRVKGVGGTGNLTDIVSIAAGDNHTCAVSSTRLAYCWGIGEQGQLGDNANSNRNSPVKVKGVGGTGDLTDVTSIAAGNNHTCAMTSTGSVYCWGSNGQGQLGDNTVTQRSAPIQVLGVGGSGVLSGISGISVGGMHSCAVTSTGNAYCWGYNSTGQLGDNSTTQRNTPVAVSTLTSVAKISGYANSTCAMRSTGGVFCWGNNGYGQLGDNTVSQKLVPTSARNAANSGSLSGIVDLNAGSQSNVVCSITTARELYCWGGGSASANGYIGDDTAVSSTTLPRQVLAPGQLPAFTQVVTGSYSSCGLTSGIVHCWGYNASGQLGDGTTTNRYTPTPVVSTTGTGVLSGIASLAASANSYCALAFSGEVFCWGLNSNGQLGDGTTTQRTIPAVVNSSGGGSLKGVISLASDANGTHVCALTDAKAIYCWGRSAGANVANSYVATASGGNVASLNPSAIYTGNDHACLLDASGKAYCWGANNYSQFGNGGTSSSSTPVLGAGGTEFKSLSLGSNMSCGIRSSDSQIFCWGYSDSYYSIPSNYQTTVSSPQALGYYAESIATTYTTTCAITTTKGAICWGYNGNGQLGSNHTSTISSPMSVYNPYGAGTGFGGLASIAIGGTTHACARTTDGQTYCWGANSYGAYGDGTTSVQYYPALSKTPNSSAVVLSNVAAGAAHSCGVANGGAYCWGDGVSGKLGNSSTNGSFTPGKVMINAMNPLMAVKQISNGTSHTCAALYNGTVSCWGDGLYGKLGNNATAMSTTAVTVVSEGGSSALSGITAVGTGQSHACALGSNGNVYCWGRNTDGQLGTNSTIATAVPKKVLGVAASGTFTGATRVTSGANHSCALGAGGKVYCWGNNNYGQLGSSSYANSKTPVVVASIDGTGELTGASEIAAGANHTCALVSSQVFCWGQNSSGQLGSGTLSDSNYPVGTLNSGEVALMGIVEISGGLEHTCGRTSSNAVMCWGSGASGQTGLGYNGNTLVAMPVVGVGGTGTLANIASLGAATTGSHTCALSSSGLQAYCWGANSLGMLGNGMSGTNSSQPVIVMTPSNTPTYFVAR